MGRDVLTTKPVVEEVKEAVEKFNNKAGSDETMFTTKELIIYFNTRLTDRVDKINDRLLKLPCSEHNEEITSLKTTIKNVKTAIAIGLPTCVGIAVAIIRA